MHQTRRSAWISTQQMWCLCERAWFRWMIHHVTERNRKKKLWRQMSLTLSKMSLHLSVRLNPCIYHPGNCFGEQRVILQPAENNCTACPGTCRGQALPNIQDSFPTSHPNWLFAGWPSQGHSTGTSLLPSIEAKTWLVNPRECKTLNQCLHVWASIKYTVV